MAANGEGTQKWPDDQPRGSSWPEPTFSSGPTCYNWTSTEYSHLAQPVDSTLGVPFNDGLRWGNAFYNLHGPGNQHDVTTQREVNEDPGAPNQPETIPRYGNVHGDCDSFVPDHLSAPFPNGTHGQETINSNPPAFMHGHQTLGRSPVEGYAYLDSTQWPRATSSVAVVSSPSCASNASAESFYANSEESPTSMLTTISRPRTKREKNRLAARKCRQKTKQSVSELQEQERGLYQQNKLLKEHSQGLRNEINQLKHEILRHSDCANENIEKYIASAADKMR